MDFTEVSRSFQLLWENKPGAIMLLVLGFFVFLFVVVDAWRHKHRHRHRHRSTHSPAHSAEDKWRP